MANLSWGLHSVTSGFLVTVTIFFVVAAILFMTASTKIDEIKDAGKTDVNNPDRLKSAFDKVRVAYILLFIAAGLSLALAVLYAGQERAWTIHQGWHAAIFLVTYALLIIGVIYAYLGLNDMNRLDIEDNNGVNGYIWAGMLMSIFAFVGLTGSGSAQVGMSGVRSRLQQRTETVEKNINEHVRPKIDEIHARVTSNRPAVNIPVQSTFQRQVTSSPPSGSVTTTAVRRTMNL